MDSAAVQDGFSLYLHGFIVANDGHWVVVQQGMNEANRQARRYHWLSENLQSFVAAPHAAIEGESQGAIINLTDRRAEASRRGQLELLDGLGHEKLDAIRRLDEQARKFERCMSGPSLPEFIAGESGRSHGYGGRSVFGWEPSYAELKARVRN